MIRASSLTTTKPTAAKLCGRRVRPAVYGERQMHYFDARVTPTKWLGSIGFRDDPGWITCSIDGRFAYPSSGEMFDTASHKMITTLEDETGRHVGSEKLLEIDFSHGKPIRTGDQVGRGMVR